MKYTIIESKNKAEAVVLLSTKITVNKIEQEEDKYDPAVEYLKNIIFGDSK